MLAVWDRDGGRARPRLKNRKWKFRDGRDKAKRKTTESNKGKEKGATGLELVNKGDFLV